MLKILRAALAVTIIVLLGGCVAVPAITTGGERTERVAQLGLNVPDGPIELTIDDFSGAVRVTVGEPGRVESAITSRAWADTRAEAEALLDEIRVDSSGNGPAVSLRAVPPRRFGDGQRAEVELEVAVPPDASLVISLANGEVFVGPVAGDITVKVANGTVTVSPRAGDSFSFSAEVTNGQIESGYPEIGSASGQSKEVSGAVGGAPGRAIRATVINGQIVIRPGL